MKKLLIPLLIIFTVLIAFGSISFFSAFKPVSQSEEIFTVDIKEGSSTSAIALTLKEKGLIKNPAVFKLFSRIKGYDNTYQAGVYSLSPSMNMQKMMEIIANGNTSTVKVTIPEGFTLTQIAEKFEALGFFSVDGFFYEIETGSFDYPFMKYLPEGKNRLEGFLYPETYFMYENATAHDCIDKMLSHFNSLCTEEHYKKAEELNLNILEAVTVASLIQRETMVSTEGPKVASVIYNRLKIGQALGIDATIQYALPEHKDRLTYDDLKVESPYNTYKNKGLPPGPICSPSIDALNAALNPADTDYYYYVLSPNKDGSHNFSESYEEFLSNKRKYKESLN